MLRYLLIILILYLVFKLFMRIMLGNHVKKQARKFYQFQNPRQQHNKNARKRTRYQDRYEGSSDRQQTVNNKQARFDDVEEAEYVEIEVLEEEEDDDEKNDQSNSSAQTSSKSNPES